MAVIYLVLKRICEDRILFALASFGLAVAIASLIVCGHQAFRPPTFYDVRVLAGMRVNPQGVINFGPRWRSSARLLYLALSHRARPHDARRRRQPARRRACRHPGERDAMRHLLAGGLLGGLAGLLILYSAGMDFTASLGLTFIGFAAAIIFGIHSPLRCLPGGIAIGVIEALARATPGMVTAMVPLLFMLIVLSAAGSALGTAGTGHEVPASRPNTLIMLVVAMRELCRGRARNPVWIDTWVILGILALIALSAGLSFGQAGILSMAQARSLRSAAMLAAVCGLRFGLPPGIELLLAIALPALLA